jgi:serine/threonine protein phosphatase PrpC
MLPLLLSPESLMSRATKLVQLALDHGGPDNITLILSQVRTGAGS